MVNTPRTKTDTTPAVFVIVGILVRARLVAHVAAHANLVGDAVFHTGRQGGQAAVAASVTKTITVAQKRNARIDQNIAFGKLGLGRTARKKRESEHERVKELFFHGVKVGWLES